MAGLYGFLAFVTTRVVGRVFSAYVEKERAALYLYRVRLANYGASCRCRSGVDLMAVWPKRNPFTIGPPYAPSCPQKPVPPCCPLQRPLESLSSEALAGTSFAEADDLLDGGNHF